MSTIRTATFLKAQQRIRVDATDRSRRGKTNKRVKCNPPNKKCGSRCIPADWDCRLTGEGADAHLMAAGKGSDPLAAIANLQRGGGRILRGLQKLNPSDIEGGRKAIIRGVVKGAPGNIKDKENLKADLVRGTIMLGAIASVGVLGIRGHGLMMGVSVYKKHIGDRLENAADKVIRKVLDNNPITGPGRQAVREGGAAVISNRGRLSARIPEADEALSALGRISTERNGKVLFRAPKGDDFNAWYSKEVKRLLTRPRLANDSAETFLRDYYSPSSSGTIKDAAIERISRERKQLIEFARQEGVDLSNDLARDTYAKKLIAPLQVTASMRSKLETDTYDMLTGRFVPEAHYSSIKNQIQDTYKSFYKEVSEQFPNFYKPDGSRMSVASDRYDFTDSVIVAHARLRARVFQGSEAIVKGSHTADLTHLQFFKLGGRQTNLGKRWSAPRGLVMAAAKEVGSSQPRTIDEALNILRINGFKGIDVEDLGPIRPLRSAGAERAARTRGFKLRSGEQEAYDLYTKRVEAELLPNGAPKYKTPDEIRRKVQGLIAKDRVGKTAPPRSSTVAPRPSATRRPVSRSKPVGATAKTSVRAPKPKSPSSTSSVLGRYSRLPIPTDLPTNREGITIDQLADWTKYSNIYRERARAVLFQESSQFGDAAVEPGEDMVRELTRKWMREGGFDISKFDSADRSDAYRQSFWTVRHDKKCGESGIAKNKKCSKRTFAVGLAVAGTLAGGAALIASRKGLRAKASAALVKPKGKLSYDVDDVKNWNNDLPFEEAEQIKDLLLERKYQDVIKARTIGHEELGAKLAAIRNHKGVIPENVDLLTDFVKRERMEIRHDLVEDLTSFRMFSTLSEKVSGADLDTAVEQMKTMQTMAKEGYKLGGMYMSKDFGDARGIYVNPKRAKLDAWEDKSEDMVVAANKAMDAIKVRNSKPPKSFAQQVLGSSPQEVVDEYPHTYSYASAKRDASDLGIAVHELGHAIHDRTNYFLTTEVPYQGKVVNLLTDNDFANKIGEAATNYGQTNPQELFAEHFSFYIFAGRRFQRESPEAYAWVEAILDKYKSTLTT